MAQRMAGTIRRRPVRETRPLAGVVVAITGGARGIGAATAAVLAQAGATVAIGDRDPVAGSAQAQGMGRVWQVDVCDRDALRRFLDEVESTCGPLDVLINNAGIMPLARLADEPDTVTARQVELNLHAVIRGSREAIQRMRPRGQGLVVNVASEAGRLGFAGAATYCATKHGVVGLSESLRRELRGTGVAVSCVMPTVVRTELATGLGQSPLVRPVTAGRVAEAIVATVTRPRFAVYVPRSLGVLNRLLALAPTAVGDALLRACHVDRVLAGADPTARADYEARAAHHQQPTHPGPPGDNGSQPARGHAGATRREPR